MGAQDCYVQEIGRWVVGARRSTWYCDTTKRRLSFDHIFEMRTLICTFDLPTKIPSGHSDKTWITIFECRGAVGREMIGCGVVDPIIGITIVSSSCTGTDQRDCKSGCRQKNFHLVCL